MPKHSYFYDDRDKSRYIGGAERARREARKKNNYHHNHHNHSRHYNEHHNSNQKRKRKRQNPSFSSDSLPEFLPKTIPSTERFFGSLLQSSFDDIQKSNQDPFIRQKVRNEICQRVGLPFPGPLLPLPGGGGGSFSSSSSSSRASSKHQFYATRASLVLEEARHVLSESLSTALTPNRKNGTAAASSSIRVRLTSVKEKERTGHRILTFQKMQQQQQQNKKMITTTTTKKKRKFDQHNNHFITEYESSFTPKELYEMRPGNCFLIVAPPPKDGNPSSSSTTNSSSSSLLVLASVVPTPKFNPDEDSKQSVKLMVFQKDFLLPTSNNADIDDDEDNDDNNDWSIYPLTTLVREMRQFEACTREKNVAFLPKLWNAKQPTHIRFSDSDESDNDNNNNTDVLQEEPASLDVWNGDVDDEDDNDNDVEDGSADGIDEQNSSAFQNLSRKTDKKRNRKGSFRLPLLNATQSRAAENFLKSPTGTLSLVQGPPGTGKTTFLVSVIAQTLLEHAGTEEQKRILVTAPTNKAIAVLATRFLEAMGDDDTSFNIVMIGVEDKLIGNGNDGHDEYSTKPRAVRLSNPAHDDTFVIASLSSPLRRRFVYTWVESLANEYESLRHTIASRRPGLIVHGADLTEAYHLSQRLMNSIPNLATTSGVAGWANRLVQQLELKSLHSPPSSENSSEDSIGDEEMLEENRKEGTPTESILELLDTLIDCIHKNINPNDATHELLATADVIFCTLSTAGVKAMKCTKRVDDLFVDEAAAATEPEILIPLHLSPKRMLAVGDPMQLPALVMSKEAAEWGLSKSMHERLMTDCGMDHIMLDVQYRMKPDISAFPSMHFYRGELMNGPNVVR